MPKLKTKKAAAKRFRVKPSGKIKCDRANHEHIATKKSRQRKNKLKKANHVADCYKGLVMRCLPNH
ncbi:MAG: 50S ribosomal protein L35 [Deltaproteobacteria bacterium]|nr:50S ribosomal protein L35 [Deltaproteobacteria bacterium]